MTPYFQSDDCTIYHGDACEIMPNLAVDHLIGDSPYSGRTHRGHDQSEEIANRKTLDYEPWDYGDVMRFVDAQQLSVSGWRAMFSDHVLQPAWEKFFEMIGLYTFAPIPYVVPGGRVRFSGDGPACWSTWINVARPKEGRFSGWGSLPGAYVLPPGERDRNRVVGGKELWIMKKLVEDYSRPGDVVLDPVCGSGTTLLAALQLGRKAIGIDVSEKACEMAAKRVEKVSIL